MVWRKLEFSLFGFIELPQIVPYDNDHFWGFYQTIETKF